MNKLKPFLLLGLCLALLSTVSSEYVPTKEKKFLPKEFKKLRFGKSLAEVMKLRKNKLKDISDASYDFRKEYEEQINRNGIKTATYYFDNNGVMPLYEIIIEFDNPEARDAVAAKKLGAPNHKDKEWKMEIGGFYPLHAWPFQSKLIYAIPLDGSEWEDGLD